VATSSPKPGSVLLAAKFSRLPSILEAFSRWDRVFFLDLLGGSGDLSDGAGDLSDREGEWNLEVRGGLRKVLEGICNIDGDDVIGGRGGTASTARQLWHLYK
jgi:hypothetical protein